MLYIFHVDTGTTITFDMKLALESVSQLREAIERECGVAASQQVLLVSGGESLEPNARVCTYSAGTDTNPIYLFSKASIESHQPPTPSIDYGSDVDLQTQIEGSLAMPATYQTVVNRAQLGHQCCVLAREQTRICERLVHDQHLQQQGWAAVVANLEDITQMFQSRADILQQSFNHYLAERQQHINLLNNFNEDLGMLSKIPILPALRAHAEGLLSPDDQETVTDLQRSGNEEALSLLKWISAKDNQSSLEQVAEQCSRGLEQFDERVMESLKAEVNSAVEAANKQDMKEIKGLGERLFGLEQLMFEAKKLVQEQADLAQALLQNQNRATNLGDASILPDLCASHRRQLLVMLQNHNHLRDIRRRCTKAKEELSVNLYHRLKWIMYVENKMMEVDGKLVMYNESLKRLRRHLEVLQQIHLAPEMYMSAVAEVVRRRTFSQAFLLWASNLACQLLTVHSEELARRTDFQSKFDGHFLNTLFPGLEDTPPSFATQAPSIFDSALPKLTSDDMQSLRETLPDLALAVSTPDLNSITQFFLSKSLTEGSTTEGFKDKEVGQQSEDPSTKMSGQRRAPLLSDRGGFESETDTEEFEKIGQGAQDLKQGSSYDGERERESQKELSEENLGNTREEVERLRSVLRCMKSVAGDALLAFRQELASLKEQTVNDQGSFNQLTDNVRKALEMHSRECEKTFRERAQELTVDHELELGDLKKLMQGRDEEIKALKESLADKLDAQSDVEEVLAALRLKIDNDQRELATFRSKIILMDEALQRAHLEKEIAVKETQEAGIAEVSNLKAVIKEQEEQLRKLEESLIVCKGEQEEAIKAATDKFQKEYKTELDNIRSRFKLMAASTMERSPSDLSLEKIERPDMIGLGNHETIIAQMKEDMETEKAAAIRVAIEKERSDCAAKLDHELRLARQRNDAERQVWFNEAMRRVIEEKERQVETHRSRETILAEECERLKDTIRRLTESESNIRQTLSETVESLEADKVRLEANIEANRTMLSERESRLETLIAERDKLRSELNDERLKINSSGGEFEETLHLLKAKNERLENLKVGTDSRLQKLEAEKDKLKAELEIHRKNDEIEVSESKKVRLESGPELDDLLRRLEARDVENKRLITELRLLTESKDLVQTKLETVESEKVNLEVELVKERYRSVVSGAEALIASTSAGPSGAEGCDKEMCASVAIVSDSSSCDVATSPEPIRHQPSAHLREKLTRSTASLIQQDRISISSCNPGDVVLVLWDSEHRNYIILQESPMLYFLHSDCVNTLDLRVEPDGSRRLYVIAEVIRKEYCHAKKNRYKVPQGTKFYQVKVRPQQKEEHLSKPVSSSVQETAGTTASTDLIAKKKQEQEREQEQEQTTH
ncbi:RB1-inducible coiled-coil protein 1 isoform X2 [Athalia rosae]|uniref:RB1-inducible coiled-coil protein 1 isoform X2 n=1 Tax=Athalia rosae TaxID=37344 RepID=UPI002034951E|nr:RB1-inducible coiled-coil protein 1 isoform X2 [Athalia rosae]